MVASTEHSDSESRTAVLGTPRSSAGSAIKRRRHGRNHRAGRVGRRNVNDFVPKGGQFPSTLPLAGSSSSSSEEGEISSTNEKDSPTGSFALLLSPSLRSLYLYLAAPFKAMPWTKKRIGPVIAYVDLTGSGHGVTEVLAESSAAPRMKHYLSRQGRVSGAEEVVDLTSSDALSDSDASARGGNDLILNIPGEVPGNSSNAPLEISDDEASPSFLIDTKGSRPGTGASSLPRPTHTAIEPHVLGTPSRVDQASAQVNPDSHLDAMGRTTTILADLDTDELEKQFRYALFYMDRKDIDLNAPVCLISVQRTGVVDHDDQVTCLFCLKHGHLEDTCPLKMVCLPHVCCKRVPSSHSPQCEHCGNFGQHFSKSCPRWRRCLKCRERGHDISQCRAPLKENGVPCDLCGGTEHLEDKCPSRWNIPPPEPPAEKLELYICCAICGLKTHLLGDCPHRTNKNGANWSLKDINPSRIVNLAFQSGPGKKESLTAFRPRPIELRIKGRAGPPKQEDTEMGDDAAEFFGPRVPAKQQGHIRFRDSSFGGGSRLSVDRPPPGYDSYQPGPSRHIAPTHRDDRGPPQRTGSYRDDRHDRYYNPFADDRRRSRSPPRRRGGDSWQPPLPSGPPPGPPPRNRGGKRSRGRGGGGSNQTRDVYRPMPSDGKKNRDRHRL